MSALSFVVQLCLFAAPSLPDADCPIRPNWHHVKDQFRSEFRYIIVKNRLRSGGSPLSEKEIDEAERRVVDVLLDERAFTEYTLKKLFQLISKRFPRPDYLEVSVHTSLEQVFTPEEDDIDVIGGVDELPGLRYSWAYFRRDKNNEFIRYVDDPATQRIKVIVLKGKAPPTAERATVENSSEK